MAVGIYHSMKEGIHQLVKKSCDLHWGQLMGLVELGIEDYFGYFLKAQHDLHGVAQAKSSDYSERKAVWFYNNKIHFLKREKAVLPGGVYIVKEPGFVPFLTEA